jgi:subtilase family serine protease
MSTQGGPPAGSYGPSEFHTGYNLPTTPKGGAAQTIAIVDAFSNPNVIPDLAAFNAQYGLPAFPNCTSPTQTACLAVLNQNGLPSPLPPEDLGWGLEIALDVQVAHEICQTCRINLYEANDNEFASLEAAVNTAAAQGADAISNSYGSYGFDCTEPGYNHPNIAVTVSSGDFGFGIACPSNLATVVSVGGTTLNLNANDTYQSETVWVGTGSGCSHVVAAQPWQSRTANWTAIGCGTFRGMTDVSADADPNTGAAVYDSRYPGGPWFQVGGTSLSSPLIAAVYALAANAHTMAYPAIRPYKAQVGSRGGLHDVTSGSNGSCTKTLQCHGGTGYDLPTGVGTPNGINAF